MAKVADVSGVSCMAGDTGTTCSRRKAFACLVTFSIVPLIAVPASITDLAWLAGCWAAADRDAGSGEQWMPPAGRTMLGISRTVSNGETVDFEFLRIVETDDGGLVLIVSPSGQRTTGFALASVSDREVIFENPDHDFPQRVIYWVDSDEVLTGRIEGRINDVDRAIEFPMKKIDCDPVEDS
jgi:hypothetical protein